MAEANALTYLDLQNAVLGRRFPAASQRANAKRWLATAYQDVWGAADWTFKRVPRASLTVTAGDNTPTMPTDFASALDLYDNYGTRIPYLDEQRFERTYGDVLALGSTGTPEAHTVVNRQLYLAPVPTADATFTLSYTRRLAHLDANGVVQAGYMTLDGDYPLWADHHSVLIPRAVGIGLIEVNDIFSWEQSLEEYGRQLDRMKDDYEQVRPALQWGRTPWSY